MIMWFYILGTLAMGFFLIKNIYNYGLYKDYAKTAIFTFEDTRPFYKAMRILLLYLFFYFRGATASGLLRLASARPQHMA